MADENNNQEQQDLGLQFEDILPWGVTGGDTGLSSRLKIKRNFDKIRTRFNADNGRYLSKINDDTAQGLITFLRGLITGHFVSGMHDSGSSIDEKGNAEFEELVTRGLASLRELFVEQDAVFGGNLSSPDFESGFPSGIGWALQKKEYVNPAGETEYKYVLECDGANIRGTLRVYEFIISQLLGENDNRIFTAMMEVDHYDAETGKVWLKTNNGRTYNVFRENDCIMVQQYQPGNDVISGGDGYITKQYELLITEVGSGGETDEEGNRLDWVRFSNFTTMMEDGTPESLIKEFDTFCRLDNLTDPERKGIIQLMTVGTNMPYMDIIYGMKTDPDEHLKGRLGNLEGLRHHLFGWLHGFGEYLINAYIVGDVRLKRTGESIDTSLEILKGRMATKIAETVYQITGEDNFLTNAEFTDIDDQTGNLRGWTITLPSGVSGINFYTVAGEAVVSSVGTLASVGSMARTELIDGRQVLHIVNATIGQDKDLIRVPSTHRIYDAGDGTTYTDTYSTEWDTLYLAVKIRVVKDGTLRIGFPDSTMIETDAIKEKVRFLERDTEWQLLQWSGTWDHLSDFSLSFSGECYISLLALTDKPLDAFKEEYSTQIIQTSRNITLLARKVTQNEIDIAALDVAATQITGRVQSLETGVQGLSNGLDGVNNNLSLIVQRATSISQSVAALDTSFLPLCIVGNWEQGGLTHNSGAPVGFPATNYYIRYKNEIAVNRYTSFYAATDHMLKVVFLDNSKNCIGGSAYEYAGLGPDIPITSITAPLGAVWARLCVKKSSGTIEPTESDIAATGVMYSKDAIMTEATFDIFVQDNLSWIVASANNIIFRFTDEWKVQWVDSNNVAYDRMWLDQQGDLYITGILHQGSTVDPSVRTNGVTLGALTTRFKLREFALAGSGDSSLEMDVNSDLTLLTGSVPSGTINIYPPSLAQIKNKINPSLTPSYFVAEYCLLNNATGSIYLNFSTSGSTETSYPRWIDYDNQMMTSPIQLGAGDYIRMMLVYRAGYYNAYVINRKTSGGY